MMRIMNTLGIAIWLSLFNSTGSQAQSPNWSVDYSQFQFRMTVSAVLERGGAPLASGGNQVAVFVGDEIRGVGNADSFHEPSGRFLAIFQVGSNVVEGETLRFQVYDESLGEVVSVRYTTTFNVDKLLGSINDPIILTENQFPKDIQLSAESYSENMEAGSKLAGMTTADGDDDIHVYTLSNFIPESAVDLLQVEGDSLVVNADNDFETLNQFSFTMSSSDPLGATVSKDFTMNVLDEPEPPTDLVLSRQSLPENSNSNYQLALITAEDEDLNERLVFTFAEVQENVDTVHFRIDDNRLMVRSSLDFELTPSFDVIIKVTDKDGLSLSEAFEISVEDEDEPEPLSNYISPNGDGFNDFLIIENPELYSSYTLRIFTPQGKEIYTKKGYDNTWDGYYLGKPLPSGIYPYIFQNESIRFDGLIYIKDR